MSMGDNSFHPGASQAGTQDNFRLDIHAQAWKNVGFNARCHYCMVR